MDNSGYYPGRPLVQAYGNGGFRFADMSHIGSILMLPSGVHAWDVSKPGDLQAASFDRLFAETDLPDFLVLGTGSTQIFPDAALREE